ncbi:MAG: N-acetyl-gamma-glutamyl-phosphate reductase [Saprospiraceae bacterium]|nr:N-acetyl-gamma-glutamyl-phosphate reductase [Saprospiraceae bacterium]
MIRAGIIGGAGYTGGELIRILLNHPDVLISFVQSKSNAGNKISSIHTDQEGDTELVFSQEMDESVDVIFFCTGHGESSSLMPTLNIPARVKIIDLSNDFRVSPKNISGNRHFVYGLPEINKTAITSADAVANPGCFATAIQLAILPLISSGHTADFYVTGITGSTGAGQMLSQTSHFSWRTSNIQAYKTLTHQHLGEIIQSCRQLNPDAPDIHFVPWRGDFSRGIFVSAQTKSTASLEAIKKTFNDFYADAAFVHLSDQAIHLKQVINTNKCLIQIEKTGDQLVIHAVIDNLVKGASGQAVQNMNLMFGLDEKAGLHLKASAF